MRKDRINYDIEPDLHDFIKKYAKKTNLSRNQVISQALKYWQDKVKSSSKQ